MWRDVIKYGVIAGVVVAAGMFASLAVFGGELPHGMAGMALGYATMLLAFSAVFVGISPGAGSAGRSSSR